jgi:hypothetical protein
MDETKSKTKWPKVCLWLLFGLMLVAGLIFFQKQKSNPGPLPSITLPDGSKLTVMAVSYGTNHSLAGPLVKLVSHAPPMVRGWLFKVLDPRASIIFAMNTPTPELMVWLSAGNQKNTSVNWSHASLSDSNGFMSGPAQYLLPFIFTPSLMVIDFKNFPRRERTLNLHLFCFDPYNNVKEYGTLKIANPVAGSHPEWQPESLPATRQAGEVEATLEAFSTGYGPVMSSSWQPDGGFSLDLGTNNHDGRNTSACVLHLQSRSDPGQLWEANKVELSDATGNLIQSTGFSRSGGGKDFFSFEPGLWPGEAAWKLRCELKCVKGFAPNELVNTGDVPLGALYQTNRPGWQTNFNGVTLGFDQLIRRPPLTNNFWNTSQLFTASFRFTGMTNDLHFELVQARTDDGTKMENVSSGSTVDGNGIEIGKQFSFRNVPLEAKSVNFTFALKKSRWVEFLVKPAMGTGHFEFPAPSQPKAVK